MPVQATRVGTLGGTVFVDRRLTNDAEATASDTNRIGRWVRGPLARGLSLPPPQFEAILLWAADSSADIQETVEAATAAFDDLT